jgi:hypothetical protein
VGRLRLLPLASAQVLGPSPALDRHLTLAVALTNPKVDEREVPVDLFELEPGLLSQTDGLVLVVHKGFTTERCLAERGLTIVARPTRGRETRPAEHCHAPCVRPSSQSNDTFKRANPAWNITAPAPSKARPATRPRVNQPSE